MFVIPAMGLSALLLAGFTSSESPTPAITSQPQDEMIHAGSGARLSVTAEHADFYQWLRNGTIMPGETKPTLSIPKVEIADAGNYSCLITRGMQRVTSRVASLLVYLESQTSGVAPQPMGNGTGMTVYAAPTLSAGSSSSCPGNYAGYVMFYKTAGQGWGWSPSNNASLYAAADGGGRVDTSIVYQGEYGDSGCGQTTVVVPHPAMSPVYRFVIYFPNNVPTTNYPIILTGFNP